MSTRSLTGMLLVAGVVFGGAPAGAQPVPSGQDAPPLMPTRDVTVLYGVKPEGAPQEQPVRVYFHTGGVMRIDGPTGPDGSSQGDMILDRNARVMTVVMNGPRIYMQIPEHDEVRTPFVLDASMTFKRTGTGSVAGLPCVQWSIVSGKGMATACVTADGVVLSESGVDGEGARGELTAKTVQYGPIDPKLLVPPPGYQRTAHPEGMGQGMGGGASSGAGPGGPSEGPMMSGPQAGPGGQSGP